MEKRICSIEGCEKIARSKGFCPMHYARWKRHGTTDFHPTGRQVCSIEGCEQFAYGWGWCSMHYWRWKRNGDPGELESRRIPSKGAACFVEECPKPARKRGWCDMHYWRWQQHGDPNLGGWPAIVTYDGAHYRVRAARGKAAEHRCVQCGQQAAQWAYDHRDPAELVGDNHGVQCPYSLDPARYQPMCKSCHKRFDLEQHAS